MAPETSFSCDDKADGMYADVEARCQAWHQCFADRLTAICLQIWVLFTFLVYRSWTFLCPNGTIFNQEIFTCVWWFDFDCSTAEGFYSKNDELYAEVEGGGGGTGSESDAVDVRQPDPPRRRPAPAAPAANPATNRRPAPAAPAAPAARPARPRPTTTAAPRAAPTTRRTAPQAPRQPTQVSK